MSQNKITVVLTRSEDKLERTSRLFEEYGLKVIWFPTSEYYEIENKEFDNFFLNQTDFDYLIFSSSNSVKFFFEKIIRLNIVLKKDKIKIVSVGRLTTETLSKYNFSVEIQPKEFNADGILSELRSSNLHEKKIVVPRSRLGRDELVEELISSGAEVNVFNIYDVRLPKENKNYREKLYKSNPDWFVFTSPSSFANFLKIMNLENGQDFFRSKKIAVIGPTTKNALERQNIQVDLMPKEYSLEGIAKEMFKLVNKN
jgi:uroporphyrinogen-III synthase